MNICNVYIENLNYLFQKKVLRVDIQLILFPTVCPDKS